MELFLILALLVCIGFVGLDLIKFAAYVEERFQTTFLLFVGEAALILALGGAVALLVRVLDMSGGT